MAIAIVSLEEMDKLTSLISFITDVDKRSLNTVSFVESWSEHSMPDKRNYGAII